MKNKNNNLFHKFFFNNAGIKICSAVIAVIAWAVIINIDDPYKMRSFNVEVETINENALKSVNKVYEIIEGSNAVVKVKGKKSVVDKLSASDIRAVADLSNLSAVNAVAIQPSLRKIISSDVIMECGQVLKVSLEDRESKQVKVSIIANGTPGNGYTVGECSAKPNMVEVAGGESAVGQIASVKVFLNVNGATEDFFKRLIPVAYDKDDNKVESSTLSFSNDLVRVYAHILEEKTIPVKVRVTGKPADGYIYSSTEIQPEQVRIAGSSRQLSHISTLNIPVDISGMTTSSQNLEQDIYIADYLPEGITPIHESETVSIRIMLEQVIKKNIEINTDKINFSALGNKFKAEVLEDTNKVNIMLSGKISVLNGITNSNVQATINCSGLNEGVYTLPVDIKNLNSACKILETGKLKVRIYNTEQEYDAGTEAPLATATAPADSTQSPPSESLEPPGTE